MLALSALGLGFTAYLEPSPIAPASVSVTDDTLRSSVERTRIEVVHLPALAQDPDQDRLDWAEAEQDILNAGAGPDRIPHSLDGAAGVAGDRDEASGLTLAMLQAPPQHDTIRPVDPMPPGAEVPSAHGNADTLSWKEHVVAPGDSLSGIFSQLGIHSQLRPILTLGGPASELQRIHPGELLRAATRNGQLETLIYDPRGDYYLEITRETPEAEFVATRHDHAVETRRRIVHAQIEQSLFLDGSRAGLSDATLMQIAEVFGWDIDFAWDIRQGDRLIVVYDRVYRDGEYLRDGPLLAAEFHNRGRTFQALRFAPDGRQPDYFTPEGKSLRQAFIRTPVEVGRISSHFGPRKHPILGYTRQHQGVDYAAPTGTPIRAAGNGRIVHRGDRGGYGKTVIIDHGNNNQTLYAHMNGYRSGQAVGSRVRQGEVIGYVGMTGLATGPHLHYEFHMHGQPVNPVTVELPRAEPLPKRQIQAFLQETAPLLAAIETVRETQIAEGPLGAGSH